MAYDITVHALHLHPRDIFAQLRVIAPETEINIRPMKSLILEEEDGSKPYRNKKDLLWKWVLEDVFDDFLSFFFPDARERFDLERGVEWLDKELEQLFPPEDELYKPRHVDKLVKVFNRQGEEECMLVHVEVQGYEQDDFPQRMFQYFSRIFDKHQKPVTAFAIFTDDNVGFHPDRFEMEHRGTKLLYVYNTYKILEQDEAELKKSENPFALVVLVVKTALAGKKLTQKRLYDLKVSIMKLLLNKKFPKKKIDAILIFLENYIRFKDKDLEQQFEQEKELIIKGRKQPMGIRQRMIEMLTEEATTKGMRQGIEQGMQQGMQQGIEQGIEQGMQQVKKRFVKNLIRDMELKDEQIAELAEVSVPFVREIRASLRYD